MQQLTIYLFAYMHAPFNTQRVKVGKNTESPEGQKNQASNNKPVQVSTTRSSQKSIGPIDEDSFIVKRVKLTHEIVEAALLMVVRPCSVEIHPDDIQVKWNDRLVLTAGYVTGFFRNIDTASHTFSLRFTFNPT